MKTLTILCFGLAALAVFPACTTVEEHHPVASTTTTTEEETTLRHPMAASAVTETRTTRSY
jgi:hypothetical protein